MKLKTLLLISLLCVSFNSFANWECIGRVIMCHTWRMWVPTGWIVAGDNSASPEHGYALVWVPDPKHEWKL